MQNSADFLKKIDYFINNNTKEIELSQWAEKCARQKQKTLRDLTLMEIVSECENYK